MVSWNFYARKLFWWTFRVLRRVPWVNRLIRFWVGRGSSPATNTRHGALHLKEMDEVLDRAGSLERLLSDSVLRNEYYAVLKRYFRRSTFSRVSYDAILNQLNSIRGIPGIEETLWSKLPEGSQDNVESEVSFSKAYGRDVNNALWRLFRVEFLEELHLIARGDMTPEEAKSSAHATLVELSYEIVERDRIPEPLTRKQRIERDQPFYELVKDHPLVHQAAAWFLHEFLVSDKERPFLSLEDADLIFEFINDLHQSPRQIFSGSADLKIPGPVLSAVRKLLPSVKALKDDRKMFPPLVTCTRSGKEIPSGKLKQGCYRTQWVRPMHGIFVGIPSGDCVGGDERNLANLTPTRWATGLLEGARTFFIEKNGHYHGYVRCVPMKTESGDVLASLEIWALSLASFGRGGQLFDIWFEKFVSLLPREWSGVMVSDSQWIDSFGVKRAIFSSKTFQCQAAKFARGTLEYIGPIAHEIIRRSTPSAYARQYGSDLIMDARIGDAKILNVVPMRKPQAKAA